MAKGGNNQKSNGSRFTKSCNASNSFVTKVASRVSGYLGGWFGTPLKSSVNAEAPEAAPTRPSGDKTEEVILEPRRSNFLSHRIFDDVNTLTSPAKRFKVSDKVRVDIDFPISPIPSTSGLLQSSTNHTFGVPKGENFGTSAPGPSDARREKFGPADDVVPQTSSTASDMKANGAADNHSDSSESTSGCSSLVPQSDRLSQSAYVGCTRKRNLEEKLKYARHLQQSRTSLYLNRSIPVSDAPGARKKPSFDVTAYGSPAMDKSLLREKLINSPFYTGQTSYGGASAYRLSRNTFYSQRNPRTSAERREGMQVQVKPSHHGSTEDLSNMSHTAKKILEALEQFSTPVNDAKRIPVGRSNVPLGTKRLRFDELSETRLKLSTPISPLNPNPGPVITGLNVPTVPDLLKLKRLERIQNSTAAARQVAVQKQEYSLPKEGPPVKRIGKIVTKLKNKEKDVPLEKLEEINLPTIPLPITTLPKFDFQMLPVAKPAEEKIELLEKPRSQKFVFSPPITVFVKESSDQCVQKSSFTFSSPLNADGKLSESEKKMSVPLMNFLSNDAVAKLKRKSISDNTTKIAVPSVPAELKTGSVMDFFSKNANENVATVKPASDTWECNACLIRNVNDSKICRGCKAKKTAEEKTRTLPNPPSKTPAIPETKSSPAFGFGEKFKPPIGSWSCKECFVRNDASATRCVACESPKPGPEVAKEIPKPEPPKPAENGFGDLFKKKANQWECPVCMIRNKETDMKCAACETSKPGVKSEKAEPKLGFDTNSLGGGFKFGIDKAGAEESGVKSAADSSTFQAQANGVQPQASAKPPQFNSISTSVGVFTFGIPPLQNKKEESKVEVAKPTPETSSTFLVSSTSGSNPPKDEQLLDKKIEAEKPIEVNVAKKPDSVETSKAESFVFGNTNQSSVKPLFGSALKGNQPEESKTANFFFCSNSKSNAFETVSSSTTDFTFGQNKSTTEQSNAGDAASRKPIASFQFKPVSAPEAPNLKSSSDPLLKENKSEPASLPSGPVSGASEPFVPSSLFNTSKITFGVSPTSPPTPRFGTASSLTTNASLLGPSAPSFTTSAFSSHTSATPSTNSFGVVSQSKAKPICSSGIAFGGNSVSFSGTANPFASSATPVQNPEPPKSFGSFGASSSIPSFGSNSNPPPAFGTGFIQSSTTAKKPPAPAPFIFGATPPVNTSASVSSVSTPAAFTFEAAKPESGPTFSFGQSTSSGFNFGSSAPSTNVFGGFGQPKTDNLIGASKSPFGSSATSVFGQSSAPPPFESTAPKFEFGSSARQQQENSPSVFQFGAAPAQPASAPAGTGFSLSVPQKFNFTGGQSVVFSASPNVESQSDENPRTRKFMKAVRRYNRDPTRRPQ